jgi:hypothetical protein
MATRLNEDFVDIYNCKYHVTIHTDEILIESECPRTFGQEKRDLSGARQSKCQFFKDFIVGTVIDCSLNWWSDVLTAFVEIFKEERWITTEIRKDKILNPLVGRSPPKNICQLAPCIAIQDDYTSEDN